LSRLKTTSHHESHGNKYILQEGYFDKPKLA